MTEYGQIRKDASAALVKKMLVKLGCSEEEAQTRFDNCIRFETMIAVVIPTNKKQRSPEYIEAVKKYYSRDQLKEAEGNVPIIEWLEQAVGYPAADEYLVMTPKFVTKLNELYTEDNLQLMKDTIIVNGVLGNAGKIQAEKIKQKWQCPVSEGAGHCMFSGPESVTLISLKLPLQRDFRQFCKV